MHPAEQIQELDASMSVLSFAPICQCHTHLWVPTVVESPDYADGAWLDCLRLSRGCCSSVPSSYIAKMGVSNIDHIHSTVH